MENMWSETSIEESPDSITITGATASPNKMPEPEKPIESLLDGLYAKHTKQIAEAIDPESTDVEAKIAFLIPHAKAALSGDSDVVKHFNEEDTKGFIEGHEGHPDFSPKEYGKIESLLQSLLPKSITK